MMLRNINPKVFKYVTFSSFGKIKKLKTGENERFRNLDEPKPVGSFPEKAIIRVH